MDDLVLQPSTSDDINAVELVEVKDAPATTEQANVEVEEEAPETVTLTKAELQEQKNAVAKKERERSERKSQREIQALRAEFEAYKAPVKAVSSDEPKLEDYDDYVLFTKAQIRWDRVQADNEREQKTQAEANDRQRTEAQKSFTEKADKFRLATPDFDEVIANIADVELSEAMEISILGSDLAAQLAYYFGENEDDLERINNLSAKQVEREIYRLEGKLASTPTKTIKQSNAPDPIKPLGASKSTVTLDVTKMTDAEWDKHERANRYKKG